MLKYNHVLAIAYLREPTIRVLHWGIVVGYHDSSSPEINFCHISMKKVLHPQGWHMAQREIPILNSISESNWGWTCQ